MKPLLRATLVIGLVWGCCTSPMTAAVPPSQAISLAGQWNLRFDQNDEGLRQSWFAKPLSGDSFIQLPVTTDLAGYGHALDTNSMSYGADFLYSHFPGVAESAKADARGFLVRGHFFIGPVWYEREIQIPESWQGKHLRLKLERALWQSHAWVDGQAIGSCDSLAAPHEYAISSLSPGKHRLIIRVDNRMIHNISTITHAYGPETQTRWNGLIGALELSAVEAVHVKRLENHPSADRKSVRVVAWMTNATGQAASGTLQVRLQRPPGNTVLGRAESQVQLNAGDARVETVIELTQAADVWDEFNPSLYRVSAQFQSANGIQSELSASFGFRQIAREGRNILVNGRRIFLRGTLDCAVYPRTGHPPTSIAEWERIFKTLKDYGFNHVRFHTWCPPEAAFEAADKLGLYLSPETAAWVDDWTLGTYSKPPAIGRDPEVSAFIRAEMRRIQEAYGNHPSFAFFCIGNEFGMKNTDWDAVNSWVQEMKRQDPRRLYTASTARRSLAADDFWITHATPGNSTRGVGPAKTDWDFAKAVQATPLPLIGHETGQRPVFPDYDALLPKFTGPLKPYNLMRYRDQMAAAGMAGQVKDFVRASAKFQLLTYKAEHEAMRRTLGYAGYQLLMLNDFTGQSEALVGILDPFWESKGVVSAADVRAWNAPTVVLARFPRYTWATTHDFTATLDAAHDGPADIIKPVLEWKLAADDGRWTKSGRLTLPRLPVGELARFGEITVPLASLRRATALTLTAKLGQSVNSWRLWAYPPSVEPEPAVNHLLVTTRFDDEAEQALAQGRSVVLLAHGKTSARAARTGFLPVYWSAGWWGNRFSSLGILCDPGHPAMADFPNDGHSDWQWQELTEGATTFLLEGVPAGFRPIVQPVTDFHHNRLLGQVFEAKVGKGKLLVCGFDLTKNLDQRPAARQFRVSLLKYADSDKFQPNQELPPDFVRGLFGQSRLARLGAKVISCSSFNPGFEPEKAFDGDATTIWHTRYQPKEDPMPHHLALDLGREITLAGLSCLPRSDQANGRIAEWEVYVTNDPANWGTPAATGKWENSDQLQNAKFKTPLKARYVKLVIKSEVRGQVFGSLAELDLLE